MQSQRTKLTQVIDIFFLIFRYQEVEVYIFNELKKEEEVKQVRLENIKLKNRLKKREQQLKAKEELAEGLHLIDFEQLKIENQTYNEKIEERNEVRMKCEGAVFW